MAEVVGTITKTPSENVPYDVDFSADLGTGVRFGPSIEVISYEGKRLWEHVEESLTGDGTVSLTVPSGNGTTTRTLQAPTDGTATLVVQGPTLAETDDLSVEEGVSPENEQWVHLDIGGGQAGLTYTIRVRAPKEDSDNVFEKDLIVKVVE